MTLAYDNSYAWERGTDRRGRAAGPRRSWASPEPAVQRETPFNSETVATPWSRAVESYRYQVIAADYVAATLVLLSAVAVHGAWVAGAATAAGIYAATPLGFLLIVALCRGYRTATLGDGPSEYQSLGHAAIATAVVIMGIDFVMPTDLPVQFVFIGVPLLLLTSVGGRWVLRRGLHAARARGDAMRTTLVVGNAADVHRVVGDLSAAPYHGYLVTGGCLPSVDDEPPVPGIPVVGAFADIAQVVTDRAVEVVVVAGAHLSGEGLRRLSWALDRVGAQLIVVPDIVEVMGPRLTVRPTAGLSLVEVAVAPSTPRLVGKAVLDRTLGLLFLAAAAPVIAIAALVVRLTSPGPAFYSQLRVGVDGSTFTMWKIRSMYVDADRRRAELESLNEGAGVLFKVRDDPRVTPVGRLLRRFSLDELPQLWNVVRGDMSLVGPRPPLASEVAVYEDQVHRRLRVKPGLTGLWQVSGRSDLSWEESVRLDLRYVDNWSLTMDLLILWKTARAVLGSTGAY